MDRAYRGAGKRGVGAKRMLRALRAFVHALILLALLVDSALVGWLVFGARNWREWTVGLLVSLVPLPVLFLCKVALDLGISGRTPDEFDHLHYSRLLANYRRSKEDERRTE